jgi:hypothetical protein
LKKLFEVVKRLICQKTRLQDAQPLQRESCSSLKLFAIFRADQHGLFTRCTLAVLEVMHIAILMGRKLKRASKWLEAFHKRTHSTNKNTHG